MITYVDEAMRRTIINFWKDIFRTLMQCNSDVTVMTFNCSSTVQNRNKYRYVEIITYALNVLYNQSLVQE